jgi:3-deoxy-7-phosphoheptulonate synthase
LLKASFVIFYFTLVFMPKKIYNSVCNIFKKGVLNMSFKFLAKLPSPSEIREMIPLTEEQKKIKTQRDEEIARVIRGEDDRFLVIIGPCSADNEESVCDYIRRLKPIQDEVKDKLILIPRIYTNKPRTTGDGYKGIASQPDPTKAPDMIEGVIAMRKMHIRAIAETGLSAADEMLYPENWGYVEDLLSYVAIGARSVEDQQHRLTVSGFDVASGMKNPTSGDYSVMLNSVYAAQHPHHFVYRGFEVETSGNPLAHVVLRGAVNKHGNSITNYHYEDLSLVYEKYMSMDLKNPAAIIDCNHANSGKKFKEQIRISKEIMHNRKISTDIHKLVKGLMIESYIEEGSQKIGEGCYGKSITDPCLGWEDSKNLIYDIADKA